MTDKDLKSFKERWDKAHASTSKWTTPPTPQKTPVTTIDDLEKTLKKLAAQLTEATTPTAIGRITVEDGVIYIAIGEEKIKIESQEDAKGFLEKLYASVAKMALAK